LIKESFVASKDFGKDALLLKQLWVFREMVKIIRTQNTLNEPVTMGSMAAELGIPDTTFSSLLKSLEKTLPRSTDGSCVKLIDRPGRGDCSLENDGEKLFDLADELLRLFDEIRTGDYIPPKQTLRLGVPNQLCLHLLPGVLQRFFDGQEKPEAIIGKSVSPDVIDVTVLEPQELTDGLWLLHHDLIDVLLEGSIVPLNVPFVKVKPMPLELQIVVLMKKRFVEMLSPEVQEKEYIMPSDLDRLPIVYAIVPVLTAAFKSTYLSRFQLPTSEAVRRLAEQGHGAGILPNLRSLLGIPWDLKTYGDVRDSLSRQDLVLRWFPILEGRQPEFLHKKEQVILVTSDHPHQHPLVERFTKAVSDECNHISKYGLVNPP
jgi:DNA-binding transcriptional LysR family regulator